MNVDELGFLSPDLSKHREVLRNKYAAHFGLIEKTVAFCHATKYKLQVHNRDGQEVFAAGLFLKLIGDTEAAVLLLERGIGSQARSLLRIALECSINLANICKTDEFLKAYILISERERLKLIKGIKGSKSADFIEFKKTLADELIEEIQERLKGHPEVKIKGLAENVGMEDFYNAQYRLYSADVHSAPISIETLFEYDADDQIRGFDWGPRVQEDFRPELIESVRLLITGLKLVSEVFDVNIASEVTELLSEFQRLGREMETDSALQGGSPSA